MLEVVSRLAQQSVDPVLFMWGMACVYMTGVALLLAVGAKFVERFLRPQPLVKDEKHPLSTLEMLCGVLLLFPFWVNSFGQFPLSGGARLLFFGVGLVCTLWALVWHVWAKINIRTLWSDGIEIKKDHHLISHGAYAFARHPMYASLLLWCWGCSFMMFNGATIVLTCLVLLPVMSSRAKDEEKALAAVLPDYALYERNVRPLTFGLRDRTALGVKLAMIAFYAFLLYVGLGAGEIAFLSLIHLYLGYALWPPKVAFSYRSKAGLMLVVWGLSHLWPFVALFHGVILAMLIYGVRYNCPCMALYEKYGRCPCFALLGKCRVDRS